MLQITFRSIEIAFWIVVIVIVIDILAKTF